MAARKNSTKILLGPATRWLVPDTVLIKRFFSNRYTKATMAVIGIMVGLYILLLGTAAAFIYRGMENWFTQSMESIVPYPAARVNGELITLSRFRSEVRTRLFYAERHSQAYSEEETRKLVASILTERTLLSQDLSRRGIAVSQDRIARELEETITQTGGRDVTRRYLKEEWGPEASLGLLESWLREVVTEQIAQEEVLRLATVRHILVSAPSDASPAAIEEARKKAEQIKSTISDAASFAETAKTQSSDINSRENGGLLGSINRSDNDPTISPAFEEAAFTGQPETVIGPVQSRFGWHLIWIDSRKGSVDTNKKRYFEDLRNAAQIQYFLPGMR